MDLVASKTQLKILAKFDWSKAYEMAHPDEFGSSCLCLDSASLEEDEAKELEGMEIAGLCWQEPLNLGGIWHLTPLGAIQTALVNE